MKPNLLPLMLLCLAALLLATCEKPERDNPWDEKNTLAPEAWAPQDFRIENVTITENKLLWTYNGDDRIEGFKLDRKKGDEPWQEDYQVFDKEARSWNDTDIAPVPNLNYQYRLYAFAGKNSSALKINAINADFPHPTDLQLEKLSDISYKLTWQDNSTGEEGFRIDRKAIDNQWVIGYGTVGENTTTFVDTNVFVGKSTINVEYRVYAFYNNHESAKVSVNTNASLTPPSYLTITPNTITSVTLNWQDNSTGEQGFKIERKYETGDWIEVATTTGASWQDNDFELNTLVYYRVNAFYSQYASTWTEKSFDATIPPPENLSITANSATSVTLNWSYNLSGHEGFKIERKIDNGSWEMLAANLTPDQTIFNDDGLDLPMHEYTYRMCAFFGEFQSNFIVEMAQYILSIGEAYKGGIVFYLDGSGGGLVCAESDQSTNAEWGCYGTAIGGTGTGVGTGAANTAAIVAGCSEAGIAAKICNDLVINGYSDWFLPSKDELDLMYQNLKLAGIGGFADYYYWSSSEYSSSHAWAHNFASGYHSYGNKLNYGRVRAVRAF